MFLLHFKPFYYAFLWLFAAQVGFVKMIQYGPASSLSIICCSIQQGLSVFWHINLIDYDLLSDNKHIALLLWLINLLSQRFICQPRISKNLAAFNWDLSAYAVRKYNSFLWYCLKTHREWLIQRINFLRGDIPYRSLRMKILKLNRHQLKRKNLHGHFV